MNTFEHYNIARFQLNDLFKLDFQLLWVSFKRLGIFFAIHKLEQITPSNQHLLMLWLLSRVEETPNFNEAWEQVETILGEFGIVLPPQQPFSRRIAV